MKSLEQRLSSLSISESVIGEEQKVLKSLEFSSRPMRHQGIPMAHQRTFESGIRQPDLLQGLSEPWHTSPDLHRAPHPTYST